MTADELRSQLKLMGAQEKEAFKVSLGHGGDTDDQLVDYFHEQLDLQARVCRKLGVKSQADKVAQATLTAAWYAKLAFWAAVVSALASIVSWLSQ